MSGPLSIAAETPGEGGLNHEFGRRYLPAGDAAGAAAALLDALLLAVSAAAFFLQR